MVIFEGEILEQSWIMLTNYQDCKMYPWYIDMTKVYIIVEYYKTY